MKTVNKQYYICEVCGKSSLDAGKIEECQSSHVRITDECVVEEIFSKGKQLPRTIRITYPDGTEGVFFNNDRKYT